MKAEKRQRFAEEDYQDLCTCAVTISFTEIPRTSTSRGGRHVEFGIALALGQQVWVVGPRENVFHCLPDVKSFDAWEDVMSHLRNTGGVRYTP